MLKFINDKKLISIGIHSGLKLVPYTSLNSFRNFSSDYATKFEEYKVLATKLKEEPGNEEKLKLYALFKQSTIGPCNTSKPGVFDVINKYKWEAWNNLGQMTKEEAMKEYISYVDTLIKSIGLENSQSVASETQKNVADSSSESILKTNKQGVLMLKLNRPDKKNALTMDMYKDITKTLNDAGKDKQVNLVLVTGAGDYYSSGNDLGNFKLDPSVDVFKYAQESKAILEDFVNAFVSFPKPLIAAVNGPAVGIMVTSLGLFDVVFCSDTATFHTPFSALSQCPESCSSSTFPAIFGTSKANEMLLFNYKMSATEALKYGFVSKIIPKDKLESEIDEWLFGDKGIIKTCSNNSLLIGKNLIRNEKEIARLKEINKNECNKLLETWMSPNFMKVIEKFFSRK